MMRVSDKLFISASEMFVSQTSFLMKFIMDLQIPVLVFCHRLMVIVRIEMAIYGQEESRTDFGRKSTLV